MVSIKILENIDPLIGEELPNLGIGVFQSQMLMHPITTHTNNFYSFKTMNGFEMGVDADWLLKWLEINRKQTKNKKILNGHAILKDSILRGSRCFDYEKLEKLGETKFGFFYKISRGIPIRNSLFSIWFFHHKHIMQLLQNNLLIVKESSTKRFLTSINYCLYKDFPASFCGMECFRLYANDTIIYNHVLKNY